MKTLAERLVWAREQKGLTQDGLAKLSGVSQSTIGNLESGLRQTARKIVNIATVLGVDPLWLAEGKGKSQPTSGIDLDGLDDRIDQIRADAIVAGSESYQRVVVSHEEAEDVRIPLVELRLSAGVTGFQADPSTDRRTSNSVTVERAFVDSNRYDPNRLVAVKVKGESMSPSLHDGSVVIINTADVKPVDGVVYAVNYEGEAVIKRLTRDAGDWWLTSDNPDQRKYHRKVCRGAECIVVGRAVRAYSDTI